MFYNSYFKFFISLIFYPLIFSWNVFGQLNSDSIQQTDKLAANYYTKLSASITHPVYRDFATSPLFFRGIGLNLTAGWLNQSDLRERIFQIETVAAAMSPKTPKSDLIKARGLSFFGQLNAFYQELWKLEKFSSSRNNIKIGGALLITQNARINRGLQNNALGLESIYNLMASAQIKRDISRRKKKKINLFLFKPILKPVKRDLRFLLNIGVLNVNYRPGYAYSYDSELVGTETGPVKWEFDNYKWSLNGWRIQTQLEYIKYLNNGNARSWSYIWRAAHIPGRHEAFQMASHQIQFTLFFNSKKSKS